MVITLFIAICFLVLIVGSTTALYYLRLHQDQFFSGPASVGVLIGSTTLFAVMLVMFTKAKRHEVLAASAGYVELHTLPQNIAFCDFVLGFRKWLTCCCYRYGAVIVFFLGNLGGSQ